MKLETAQFGQIEIEEDHIYLFEQGIPGFEHATRFVFIDVEEHESFSYMQSVDDKNLSFIVVDPFEFYKSYEFNLPDLAVEQLQVYPSEQIKIRTIVTVREKLEHATTNLVAPIVLNDSKRLGKQVILTSTSYTTRHKLFEASNMK
ncbi:flagellar assembly protein FliW [Cohnella sp. AR92]|uniref:flagellar assembly protein FliW n=1 Tax=Cohnella sp. AR92 TaxID=648716 RepID=UPI0013151D05|nr:flagellar assembly protein FliW [Cohnella sp. AR92]